MIKKSYLFCLFFLCCEFINTYSQPWITARNEGAKFDEVVKTFETYGGDTIKVKGAGIKAFSRWMHRYENRLNKNGQIETGNQKYQIYQEWLRDNPQSQKRSSSSVWKSEGPNTTPSGYYGLGRINAIGFHPTNTNIIYAGAAGGGLWKTVDGGTTWTPLTDQLGTLGVSSIAIRTDNPDIIYIATGDADAYDNYSIGVMKSNDGGLTWNTTGLSFGTYQQVVISKIILHPQDNNTILVSSNIGIYKSTDGGVTWSAPSLNTLIYDLEFNPNTSSNTVYAAGTSNIWRSYDRGSTWNIVHTAIGTNRCALAIAPSDSSYVYGIFSSSANSGFSKLVRTTNGGTSWSTRSTSPNILGSSITGGTTGGQGWYDLAIVVTPTDKNTINIGGVNHWQSTDGGANWSIKSHWSEGSVVVHADKHALEYQGNVLWEGNDGGIYKSTDSGTSWTDMTNGMAIGQVYRLDVAQSYSRTIAGLQDNGTKNNTNSNNWVNTIGGDGMDCNIHPIDGNIMYGASQYGNIHGSRNGGISWTHIRSNIPFSGNGAWITPHSVIAQNPKSLIIGFKSVFKSSDYGNNWINIGNNLFSSSTNILYLEPSKSDSLIIYAGTTSLLKKTVNHGTNWTTLSYPGLTPNVTSVHIHPTDPNKIWVTRANYNMDTAKVHVSSNGGSTWSDITYNLPDIPARTMVYHGGRLYVGMDVGVYYLDDGATSWVLFNSGLPNVEIADLEVSTNENKLYAATYGRGIWGVILDPASCPVPDKIEISAVDTSSANITWASMPSATSYEWIIQKSKDFPTISGTNTFSTSQNISNLTNGPYNVFVRSVCGVSKSNWLISDEFYPIPSCGDTIYDPGGKNDNYFDLAYYEYKIMPSAGKVAKVSFDFLDVEEGWDALFIYDGPDASAPLISSGNPPVQSGYFPAGSYYGTSNIGNFGSMHPTGQLYLLFGTDDFTNGAGWSARVTCADVCPNFIDTKRDNTYGSIRHVISCNSSGNMSFDASIINDTLIVSAPISITQNNQALINALTSSVIVKNTGSNEIFNVASGITFSLENITILHNNAGPAIINNGILNLKNIIVNKASASNPIVNNSGTLNLSGINKL